MVLHNKHQLWTPVFEKIANKYGLDLDAEWNTGEIKHRGRHSSAYHQWVYENMRAADVQANGDTSVFKALFKEWVVDVVKKDPILRGAYWNCPPP